MAVSDEFIKYCVRTLEVDFGQLSDEILYKISSKKKLNENSDINDFNEFIDLVEVSIGMLSGKNKAVQICDDLRTKAADLKEEQKVPEISLGDDAEDEINEFLTENNLQTESDINDYAKYITLKYRNNKKNVEKEIFEKVKFHIRNVINRKTIEKEIDKFLTRYAQPTQADIDDFVNYIHLIKLNFQEDELREQIERERLIYKFQEPRDKKRMTKPMQKQKLSYLIKDDSRTFDEFLDDFQKLATPSESDLKDTLEGLGFKHMIKKK